jgi:predicted molibdopterin-dependent oxidoreductase YjgC
MNPVTVRFLPDDRVVVAQPGEALLTVAQRAGVTIPTGCMMGSCHACEVELNGEPVCSCITVVPDGWVSQGGDLKSGAQDSGTENVGGASCREIVVDIYGDPAW